MDDHQIVAGVRLGDREAVAALYDRYADVLHDYARRRTHAEADAADVVHDAFLVAVDRIEQLRDPDRLRPWLYAIARTELHRRYRHAARYAELDTDAEWREPVSQEPGPDVQFERAELVALLREATAGLADSDRELLDLHLRHGLIGADLAAAAGMPARHASVALERVKGRLVRTLGVVLLSRAPACEEFAAIRATEPVLTPLARKRLARHVDNCQTCTEEQRRRLRPEVLLAALPILPAPPELRHRLVSSQDRLPPTGQWWDRDGFPWPSRPRSRRRVLGWVAAAAVLLLLGGGVLVARPLLPERAVAVGSPTASPELSEPSESSTAGPAVPGTVLTPATTTVTPAATTTAAPTTTTTTRRTTTTVPPTTTIPPDTAPPEIDTARIFPTSFSTTTRGRPSCQGNPTRAAIGVVVTDPSGVASVTMTWTGPGGSGGTVELSPVSGDTYAGAIGPIVGDNIPSDSYPLTVTVVATDNRDNESKRATTFVRAVDDCS